MAVDVAVLNTLALIASSLPNVNTPIPVYAVVASDTLLPLTVPTSWGEFAPRYDTQISDYPVESGAFALYNKVRRPITINVTMIKAGSDVARFAFLAAIQAQETSNPTQLYTIVSPQAIFKDYAITGISYETRPEHGTNLLYLTITFTQVQQIATSAGVFPNTAASKSQPTTQVGQVYTQTSTPAQDARINSSNFNLN